MSYSVTEFNSTVSFFLIFLRNYFLSYEIIFFLTISYFFLISYISKMKITTSNVKVQTHDLCI